MQGKESVILRPARNVLGSIGVPGDKSISHRYAMLAALAASMGGLWVIATARHTLASGSGSPSRRPAKTT